jgi:hypothetical protein
MERLDPSDRRIGTMFERIRHFPNGVKILFRDCLRYKDIYDASRTPLNAWTIHHPSHRQQGEQVDDTFKVMSSIQRPPGRIPRRQYEQQRRARNDAAKMLPLVLLWIPPIIGYLPLVFAVAAPRQALSRQFHNRYEILCFSAVEYRQRKMHFEPVSDRFWTIVGADNANTIALEGNDEAGPVFLDPLGMFLLAFASPDQAFSKAATCSLSNLSLLSRPHLIELALALGVHQSFPSWASELMTFYAPTSLLRFRIRQKIELVRRDDCLLLQEQQHENRFESLTDVELVDACLMRSLPVDLSPEKMRACLTNHLTMIASVTRQLTDHELEVASEGFALFSVHLSILRQAWKR